MLGIKSEVNLITTIRPSRWTSFKLKIIYSKTRKKNEDETYDLWNNNMKQKKDRERVIDELTNKITASQDKMI